MNLENEVALITGGGKGIGKATALLLAKKKAKVVITDINEEDGDKTLQEIKGKGGEAIFIKHDVSSEEDWIRAVNKSIDRYKFINILFNNAGIFTLKPLFEISLDEWNKLMNINVTGTFLGMKHVVPHMIKNKKGSIINASSTAAINGAPNHSLYGASKGAIRSLTKHAATEFAPNVRVNSIYPGFVKTQMIDYASELSNTKLDNQASSVPLNKLGTPTDVANLVLYLASDMSSYITGSEFVVDGGLSAGPPVWEIKE
ncbi:NAD(P)-dependent dehydrogenase (short-subunit alcohol dehydrogenase family) [Virgibacillus halotolerans]|uniref:SDR family NAD(P)-dependent oxidoreductase n=1 Tax=Virgibacillus halotolerans TaxID=1071053 RepID=UPI0019613019|nr:SDR family oxidoreductase [Virgibacillus halotolerans]MBM7598999.1 NAD(P)-dependent dehydrogenase (short-subunit alcohol dehydrogenase family) [Virgibacillus halotolerans]